nr:interferon-induced gtp-binding protein mx2 [Quercus suber]
MGTHLFAPSSTLSRSSMSCPFSTLLSGTSPAFSTTIRISDLLKFGPILVQRHHEHRKSLLDHKSRLQIFVTNFGSDLALACGAQLFAFEAWLHALGVACLRLKSGRSRVEPGCLPTEYRCLQMPDPSKTDAFDTTTLQGLQPSEHLELLDVIDQLRAQGLNEHLDLPQLIVCGDQSSGKSSVLEAISGVPFPKKDNLCTRFATEVVLRRDDSMEENHVSVTITPSSMRPHADRVALDAFSRDLQSMADLPDTIAEVTVMMGLGATGSAFAADILRLEVRGPHMPQLTIVDLPGLVHSENKFQSAEDIALVNKLVGDYMAQERSVILAVVSAKNDYANQIVLTKTRQVDPHGCRTLGIITKPDALSPGSASETAFFDLAQNGDIKFSLGWHVVRNPDTNEATQQDPESLEHQFFRSSRMGKIDPSRRGITSLRKRLSEVLFMQIKRELPSLITEILVATEETRTRLERMGRSRVTFDEKQHFVMDLGRKFQALCFAACEGLYENAFFAEHSSSTTTHRLRAVIQNANSDFAARMLRAPLQVQHYPATDGQSNGTSGIQLRARELTHSYRGKELPGTFNPALIGQLFRELSRSWGLRAREHAASAWVAARTTTIMVLESIAEPHVREECLRSVVDPALETMQRTMNTRLNEYLATFERHPITYNHYLTETVQKTRRDRDRESLIARCRESLAGRHYTPVAHTDVEGIVDRLLTKTEPDMDIVAAEQLADYATAYYKVAIKRFIDEVPAHTIEPALLTDLPDILDAPTVLEMPKTLIEAIGGESEERRAEREILKAKLVVFDRSSRICRTYAKTTQVGLVTPAETEHTVSESGSVVNLDDAAEEEIEGVSVNEGLASEPHSQRSVNDSYILLPSALAPLLATAANKCRDRTKINKSISMSSLSFVLSKLCRVRSVPLPRLWFEHKMIAGKVIELRSFYSILQAYHADGDMSSRTTAVVPPQLPPLKVHSTAIVAEKAQISGTFPITICEGAIIQPWARIRSSHGKVVIGKNSTVSEKATIGLAGSYSDQDSVVIGENVSVETGAVIEAREVGNGSVVEVNARLGRGTMLGQWSKIAPLEFVADGEVVKDFEVIYSDGKRRIDTTVRDNTEILEARRVGHDKMMDVLRTLIVDGGPKWR